MCLGKAPELKLEAEERLVVNGVRVVTMDSAASVRTVRTSSEGDRGGANPTR